MSSLRVVSINLTNFGSTGKIMNDISEEVILDGGEILNCIPASRDNYKNKKENQVIIGNLLSRRLHILLSKFTGYHGCFSFFSTVKFLYKINKFNPNIIHLHNIHYSYINLPLLFYYIKKKEIKVVWTLHDCWAFTGHCPHFIIAECNKWIKGCYKCSQYKEYPYSAFDNTKIMWRLKKRWFTNIPNMVIVTPSKWLSNLVKRSFLKKYECKVIYNGIDLNIFKERKSKVLEKYNIQCKYMVLGVSFGWSDRKGLDVFIDLSKRLSNEFSIVLVGVNDEQRKIIPNNIYTIAKTNNQYELAELYSAANVFVNPTKEEVLGLVNIEATACGTPVITYNTGGCPECIDKKCGTVIKENDLDLLVNEIYNICYKNLYKKIDSINNAKKFDKKEKCKEYTSLYKKMIR